MVEPLDCPPVTAAGYGVDTAMELVGTTLEWSNRLVLMAPTNLNTVPLVGRRVVPDDDEPGTVAEPAPESTVAPTP